MKRAKKPTVEPKPGSWGIRRNATKTFQPDDDVAAMLERVKASGAISQTELINRALALYGQQALEEIERETREAWKELRGGSRNTDAKPR